MIAFESTLIKEQPDLVLVVGDVNSTLACTLVASKLHVPVAHVEAGLRSFDRRMPEEINRVVTDQIAELLFTTERDANENLLREGVDEAKIHFVGNVMIDTLLRHKEQALVLNTLKEYQLEASGYALLTLHRPPNVDTPETLAGILYALAEIQSHLPIIFPAHPRTMKRIAEFGFKDQLAAMPNLRIIDPLGYLAFLNLMTNARLMLTDSGGIQEETTILGVPCLTLRENTERPVMVTQGTNKIAGNDPGNILSETLKILQGSNKSGNVPELWDGQAAERLINVISQMVIS